MWLESKIILYLWHVQRAWVENVLKEIRDSLLGLEVLKRIINIIFICDGSKE